MQYQPRKRFRSDQHAARAEATALRVRRHRMYEAAVRAGQPSALAAEEARDYMRPFNVLRAEKNKVGGAERERLKTAPISERLSSANLERVHAECMLNAATARARYLKLRDQAIAEFEAFS